MPSPPRFETATFAAPALLAGEAILSDSRRIRLPPVGRFGSGRVQQQQQQQQQQQTTPTMSNER
jgi:hypothetical protein